MSGITRRTLLKGTLAGSASLLSFNQLFNFNRVFGQSTGEEDAQTILNLAATAELYATTHYYTVLTRSNIALNPDEVNMLMGFLDAELQHLEFLYGNSAAPVVTEFYVPTNIYSDRDQFSLITEQLETAFVAAYLAATRQLSVLGESLLAATSAQVAVIEQEHLALVRGIGGRRPNNVALGRALFYNVSEAVPALQPFFEGGEGYEGPITYPGADAIRELIRDAGVMPTPPFTDTAAFGEAAAAEAQTSGACTVTSGGSYNCNLRSGPGLEFAVVDRLVPGAELPINGQAIDNDSFVWWRAATGDRWVRSDIVTVVAGECGGLPQV